jgi:hypothetical protein
MAAQKLPLVGSKSSALSPALPVSSRMVKNLKRIEKAWFPVS